MPDMMQTTAPTGVMSPQAAMFDRPAPPDKARLMNIVGRLQSKVDSRIGLRQGLEQRWIADLEQYHGRYDEDTTTRLFKEERSGLFINMTQQVTEGLGARLKDLLFPTDDKNYGINPTPVPELAEAAEKAVAEAQAAKQAAAASKGQGQTLAAAQGDVGEVAQAEAETTELDAKAMELQGVADAALFAAEEGRRRSQAMEKEIDDQLTECLYQSVKRDQIDQAMKLGTGVSKGPVTGDRVRRGWKKKPAQQPDGSMVEDHTLEISAGTQPAYRFVDLWSFFPDMQVTKQEDADGTFERHLLNGKKLRELQHLQGFDKDAIRRLLTLAPTTGAPSYLAALRNIRADMQSITGDLYHVFEYSGPLDSEDMRDLAAHMMDSRDERVAGYGATAYETVRDIDPLNSVNAIVWFCQNELLKFAVYPFDSGETMYSVFNLVKDEASIFGYGMPSQIRDPQSGLNAAVRMLMDNAGVTSGPQIVFDKTTVEPENGSYILESRKIWVAKNGINKENPPFQVFNIESRQAELQAIIQMFEHFIDVQSSLPQVLQPQAGDPGVNNPTPTATGSVIMHNAAQVRFRAIVKNFDDDVTVPDIRRLYDWNMQFNPKEEIKGDYEVDARGSSVLLVREMQASNLMVIAMQFGGHPIFGPMLRNRELLKKIFQAFMVPAEEVMLSDSEIDIILSKAAAESDAAVAAAEAKEAREAEMAEKEAQREHQVALENMKADTAKYVADRAFDAAMNRIAADLNRSVQEVEKFLAGKTMDNTTSERKLTAEIAVDARNAEIARQHGEIPTGSGGSVSGGGKTRPARKK